MVNSSIMEHSSHQQASGALSSSSAMSAGGEADAAVNYDRALADLCAIGEPSLLATALAQLQRNEEDPSSVGAEVGDGRWEPRVESGHSG